MKQSVVLQIPVRLQVCSHGLVVQVSEKMRLFELMATIKEIYHISDIREVRTCMCTCVDIYIQYVCRDTLHTNMTLCTLYYINGSLLHFSTAVHYFHVS